MSRIITIIFISISIANATIIHVPDDFETIQGGIDEAEDGDTALALVEWYFEIIG